MTALKSSDQSCFADMGVNLRRLNSDVAQQLLNDANVCAVVKKMSSKAMAERTGRDVSQTCPMCDTLNSPL